LFVVADDPMKKNTKLKNPPLLEGYLYDYKDAIKARDSNKLLCIRLETSLACNVKCEYCFRDSGKKAKNEMPYEDLKEIVTQAKKLGAKSVVIIGGGEPTVYPHFKELVEHIHSLKMVPVVITNNQKTTKDLAKFLFKNNASVMIKLDSLREEVMDKLTGVKGSGKKTKEGLENLLNAGYKNTKKVKLSGSFVTNKLNIDEVETLWRFCRERNMFPNMEIMTPNGRARNHLDWIPNRKEIMDLRYRLLEIDQKEYGYTWVPYMPLTGAGCRQLEYSMCVTVEGYARPCAAVLTTNLNVRPSNKNGMTLSEVMKDPFIQKARNAWKQLEGKCGKCEYRETFCVGCRGISFTYALREGKEPFDAIVSEDPYCSKDGPSKTKKSDAPETKYDLRC